MIEPPIDKLISKVGSKFALACVVSKRAHMIAEKNPADPDLTNSTILTRAAQEFMDGEVEIAKEEDSFL